MSTSPFQTPAMDSTPWRDRLKAAVTEAQVVAIVVDYLASIPLRDLARLPGGLVPKRPHGAADIAADAFELLRAGYKEPDEEHPVKSMGRFYAEASIRISELLGKSVKKGVAHDDAWPRRDLAAIVRRR